MLCRSPKSIPQKAEQKPSPADAGEAALPGQGLLATRVKIDLLKRGRQVLGIRDLREVEILHVAEVDQPADHPV